MSLHHIIDKQPFYRKLRFALREGGVLAFADELCGAVGHTQELHWSEWLAFARLPEHLTEQEIEEIITHMYEFDHYETLPGRSSYGATPGSAT